MTEKSEELLIRQAQAGDAEAFCQLAKAYGRRVHSLAMQFCKDTHNAEDLSQEVWLKAYKALHTFRGESSFYTWIRRVLVNTYLNGHRGNRLVLVSSSEGEHDGGFDPIENAEHSVTGSAVDLEKLTDARLLVEQVMGALRELTDQQRLIFLLKHREGMTYLEIAELLGCSVGTVKKSLFRSLIKIRAILGIQTKDVRLPAYAAGER